MAIVGSNTAEDNFGRGEDPLSTVMPEEEEILALHCTLRFGNLLPFSLLWWNLFRYRICVSVYLVILLP
jgi:hypothetical protein